MKRHAGALVLTPTDLNGHLACAHLTGQEHRLALGLRGAPWSPPDPHADLIRRRGDAHERRHLARLVAEAGDDWADLSEGPGADPARAAARTAAAMRAGTRLIFQATLFDGRWQGRSDFLVRVDAPSGLGEFAYEVLDTKLARRVKPDHVHQLCLYSRLVGAMQGREPDRAHVILGDDRVETVALDRYRALHRHVCRRLEGAVAGDPFDGYPEPADNCPLCRFSRECDARRRADDHLSLVAGARRDHRQKLAGAGIGALAELAEAPEDHPVPSLAPARYALLHHQARLQLNARRGAGPVRRHLAAEPERGYARLPEPSPGDVFFDLEGDPYATPDGGIEYLWGWSTGEGYTCLWAHTHAEERAALEGFVAAVEERRLRWPDLHVFHYAAHEASTLRSLAVKYATCEATVDDWLRRGVLVDLYAVVRQGLQVGEEGYSLKKLEPHHGFVRHEKAVREGGGSIVAYEGWLETGDDGLLRAIREYNREDCESTGSLYAWLRERMRPEAERQLGVDFRTLAAPPAEDHDPPQWLPEVEALIARLHDGLPQEAADDTADGAERRLLGHLLLYHYRESKPEWWAWFELGAKTAEELVEEREAVGLIELARDVEPEPYQRSRDWTYRYPDQEVRLSAGTVLDPLTGAKHKLVRIGDGELVLRLGKTKDPPEPRALISTGPTHTGSLREAIVAVAESLLADDGRFAGVRSVLRRERPRLASGRLGPHPDDLVAATLGLDESHLAVQGPPGTGKTYNGARMIVAAMRAGRRVAITANSHAAIQNLMRAVEHQACAEDLSFAGICRSEGYVSPHRLIDQESKDTDICDGRWQLVAGTAWLFSSPKLEGAFDLLVVDEAGQLSLAHTVAAARSARSLVLLGDPQQLPQVNRASHPGGSGASVLGHLLAGHDVIPPDRGVLLPVSWRMHPEVCAFVSDLSYEGALRARPECARRRVDAPGALTGAGLRVIEVEHEGRGQDAPEEAAAIAAACAGLLAGTATVTDDTGAMRLLVPDDILVVAPYNLAVSRIRASVPAGVRVGTVDRFQGQEAPVVFFAMTSSSGEDVPRGLDFVFDRNRLNVAVSRAQCLAVLVHCPRLLSATTRSLEQMALLDGVCRFVEAASVVPAP